MLFGVLKKTYLTHVTVRRPWHAKRQTDILCPQH